MLTGPCSARDPACWDWEWKSCWRRWGGFLTVPGLSVTRRAQPTQTEPQEDTLTCTRLHRHPLSATERHSDPHPQACREKHQLLQRYPGAGQINRDTPTHRASSSPFLLAETHRYLCRERGSHLRNEHTYLSPSSVSECTKLTRDGTCTGTVSPPTLSLWGWLCLPLPAPH